MSAETENILETFKAMLKGPTGDGQNKRNAGIKPHWTVDGSHVDAAERHMRAWALGDTKDEDSGLHPLIHAAWRLLAVAWQEDERFGRHKAPTERQLQFWHDCGVLGDGRDLTQFGVN